MAHITGGGLLDNLPRMLPPGLAAELEPAAWAPDAIFDLLVGEGAIPPGERYRAFNMGIGFVLAVAPEAVDAVLGRLVDGAAAPAVVGRVVPRAGDGAAVRGLVGNADGGERDA
jgi:phosphoribosylformylglycinamidine cyclo-ligase